MHQFGRCFLILRNGAHPIEFGLQDVRFQLENIVHGRLLYFEFCAFVLQIQAGEAQGNFAGLKLISRSFDSIDQVS